MNNGKVVNGREVCDNKLHNDKNIRCGHQKSLDTTSASEQQKFYDGVLTSTHSW